MADASKSRLEILAVSVEERLLRHQEDITEIKTDVKWIKETMKDTIDKLDTRIGWVEKKAYLIMGGIVVGWELIRAKFFK